MQVQSCLDRPIGIFAMRQPMVRVDGDIKMIRDLIEWSGDNAAQSARKIGAANTTINRIKNGSATTRLGRGTLAKLKDAYPRFPGFVIEADMPEADAHSAYVDINVLPSYAGMGGGGTGEGDQVIAKLPRR